MQKYPFSQSSILEISSVPVEVHALPPRHCVQSLSDCALSRLKVPLLHKFSLPLIQYDPSGHSFMLAVGSTKF